MANKGTTAGTAAKMRNASTSGVRHGPADKNVKSSASPRGVFGKGAGPNVCAPIKGSDKGGVE